MSATEADGPIAPSLLDRAATRRAIREAAQSSGPVAQQAVEAAASLRGPTAAARLAGQVEQAGRGDCLKGDYAGAGLGLLSLPFLTAALLRDDCAK